MEYLKLGGFPLDKWASNSQEFMNTCSGDNVESNIYFDGDDFTRVKVLGLFWDMNADVFSYKINFPQITNSKRMLLSNIARIFDPIGGLSPIVFWCKCLLQSLWKLNIGWDELVPLEVMTQWEEFTSQIETLAKVQIPRFICNVGANDCQLIGFCDASEKGYGAILTIPKLELCAAHLLARLVFRVMNVYRGMILFNKILAWTDSQTVLSWLNTPSHILKMFVANRVVEINDCIPHSD
ncbi:hypothetical protein J437_LFUL015490 [Ladona fulva]|uniref:Uncharacterized protein n=1 Tax=Ladona fulva TaxID=123851 RepID=A0A8K0KI79_LADFU|nr:hypothetical protein J437_LFUL015490 [Ladona fulva]